MIKRLANVFHWLGFIGAIAFFCIGASDFYNIALWNIKRIGAVDMPSHEVLDFKGTEDVVDVMLPNGEVIKNIPKDLQEKEILTEKLKERGLVLDNEGNLKTFSGKRPIFPFDPLDSRFRPHYSDAMTSFFIGLFFYVFGWTIRYILSGEKDLILWKKLKKL